MFVCSREILVEESNVQRVDSPVTVSVCNRCLEETLYSSFPLLTLFNYIS